MAQNILVFLKAKCTQEGHTYWLFRRQGEDAIKLYDLTSLDCFKVTLMSITAPQSINVHNTRMRTMVK